MTCLTWKFKFLNDRFGIAAKLDLLVATLNTTIRLKFKVLQGASPSGVMLGFGVLEAIAPNSLPPNHLFCLHPHTEIIKKTEYLEGYKNVQHH